MTAPALEVRGLTRTYGDGTTAVAALTDINLTFPAGTFTALMGPSGSGKTTFLSCASGLELPTSGQVLLAGDDLTELNDTQRTKERRQHIGLVFQSFHLLPYLTARQNVALPLRLAGRRAQRSSVDRLLTRVGLPDRGDHLPRELSGGEQQRVAIARAIVTDPAVVLADEPTGALDSATAHKVLALLHTTMTERGSTVVMVTHDPVAASHADSVVFLVDGRVVGRMSRPTATAVAGQLARLDDLAASAS